MPIKRILVTGGAGFIGKHLCISLIDSGHKVICLDNLITSEKSKFSEKLDSKSDIFKFINHDITQRIEIEDEIDEIFHLASPASPIDYLKLPIETLKVGALGTHNTLGLAKEKKAKFLLASTSEVYGDPEVHPQPESYWGNVNPTGPRGVYDEAKRFAEAITIAYHKKHNIPIRIARIFNTYGPGMRFNDGRAIPGFIYQTLSGEPITIFGDGKQTRSFCYITDLVEGLKKLMDSDFTNPVNLGNPKEMTIEELASTILNKIGGKSEIIYKELPEDDPKIRQPDITRAKRILNWNPKTSFDIGLEETIKDFKIRLGLN
tara:strand:+ start:5821 stop:6774 length:954 start_codon:yes stop_codon:yes gene_type:complete